MEYEYYRNAAAIEGKRLTLARLVPKLQECITEWNSLQVGNITTENLHSLIFYPENLLHNSIKFLLPVAKKVAGFSIRTESVIESLILPSIENIKHLTNGIVVFLKSNNVSLEFFEVENNEVKISKKFEEVVNENTAKCKNDSSEMEVVMLTERILEAVTELHTKLGANYTSETYKLLSSRMFVQVGESWMVAPFWIQENSHLLNGKVKNESEKY